MTPSENKSAPKAEMRRAPSSQRIIGDCSKITLIDRINIEGKSIIGKKFQHRQFVNVNALRAEINDCEFINCHFEKGYFRNTKFINCKFIGSKFYECNFHQATLLNCSLNFSKFYRCELEIKEILASLPMEPNIRQQALKTLKVNAIETGDHASIRLIVLDEIETTKIHNWRALVGADSYYKNKYSDITSKIQAGWSWLWLNFSGFIWGNGERPIQILISGISILSVLTLVNFWAILPEKSWTQTENGWLIFKYTVSLFFDAFPDESFRGFLIIDYMICAMRYVYVGLFISVLYKTFSHR